MTLNINEMVTADLTPAGLNVLLKDPKETGTAKLVVRDQPGNRATFEGPLWVLMQTFGPHLHHSGPTLFVDNRVTIGR